MVLKNVHYQEMTYLLLLQEVSNNIYELSLPDLAPKLDDGGLVHDSQVIFQYLFYYFFQGSRTSF